MASGEWGRRRISLHVDIEGADEEHVASASLDPNYFGHAAATPATPAKDPGSIDRRGLVGVGELATPRWTKHNNLDQHSQRPESETPDSDDPPDSPWTIEAVDEEPSELKEETMPHSITSESGGEEIVYPRKPPSSFAIPARRARKRTSDEFEMDQHGSLVSKTSDSPATKARKHLSLGARPLTSPRDPKSKDRRRESAGLSMAGPRHNRHSSASSSSDNVSKRVPPSDFSHLPPSPSASSLKHFLKQSKSPTNKDSHVAHSLLRGTQEGWGGLDDEATRESLRKLDGLSGKTARARASIGSFHRSSRSSTPAKASSSTQDWEGVEPPSPIKRKSSLKDVRPKEDPPIVPLEDIPAVPQDLAQEKTPKRSSARSSMNGKRTSASSTNYTSTPTTSSRDSTSMSASTSMTTPSSSRHSISKSKRNSAGSDLSASSDAASLKDRVASLAASGDGPEDHEVPPVPPLPKDLAHYKSPPPSAAAVSFPSLPGGDEHRSSHDSQRETMTVSDAASLQPRTSTSSVHVRHSQQLTPDAAVGPPVHKTPSKKWSFTNALKLSSSPSSSSPRREFSLSPRSVTFGQQLRKSTSKDQTRSPSGKWPTSDAMSSAASLTSMSSTGSSSRTPGSGNHVGSERANISSRGGSGSSASNHTTSVVSHSHNPSSPTSSIRRSQSKRLTPSSIPFFRRSSSQSMQLSSNSATYSGPASPSNNSTHQFPSSIDSRMKDKRGSSPDSSHVYSTSTSVPGTASRKSSIISLGLPSLLKSSSRRSLHAESKEAAKEITRQRESIALKEKEKTRNEKEKEKEKTRNDKLKKDDKDRSESRISVLMGRKRGKTLSSTNPPKPRSPAALPPIQVPALETATAQRVARLKSTTATSTSSSTSSRLTSQTLSSLQKQSDASLRSSRNQLPTIAGSPSVGTIPSKDFKDGAAPSSLSSNVAAGLPKETPTKIPRISSRTSGLASPSMKSMVPRRSSVNASSTSSTNPSPTINEFGVMENGESSGKTVTTKSARGSPSTATKPARLSTIGSSVSSSVLPRKSNRESLSSFAGLRKSSTGSVSASNNVTSSTSTSSHRFSALSPSKGLKLLSPKVSLQAARTATATTTTQSIHQTMSPSSSRQSLTTPSPSPSLVDDDERLADEEMMAYIRRQQQKKLNAGTSQIDLDKLLEFPEPIAPTTPLSPSAVLKGSQNQYLSEYERQEIGDFPNVYYIGHRSRKKMATQENTHNNHGYDDERGDYLIVPKDHLSYRYELVDTLGKGSFGQVLHCRDHCTGDSVAIKIIRNKKRFHHQALVEIKILDNLRKWDAEEKHFVIKMTDHFYFRNHLCIAMELLSINLYELIKANGFVGFTTNLIRRFTSQMLMSLTLMRHHRIVHCDLKPENVLLRHPQKSGLKVIDFGSSCFEHEKVYTYIQSRFYRSPEVILGMNYHMAIDMWSLGCILAELYTGFPIFPGENEQEQLSCIMEVLGAPDKEFVNRSSRKKLFFDAGGAPRAVVNSKGRRRRPGTKTLAQVLRCSDEDFVDFISKCLMWDPERRIKPQAALRHSFVTAGRRPKPVTTPSKTMLSSSSLVASRSKHGLTTPRKSEIGAPTPLTARTTRTTTNANGTTAQVPTTPNSASQTSKSFRSSQSASTRTLNLAP